MSAVAAAWDRFWFAPRPTSTLAVFRICVGGLALVSAVLLWPDLEPFYGLTALGNFGARVLVLLLALAAACLVVGFRSRIAALAVFVCLGALVGTNPFLFNSGDTLLRLLVLFLVLAPAGAALSVDCRRKEGAAWRFPLRPAWPLRLVQIQIAVMYLAAVVHKLGGTTWRDGTAASYPTRIPDMVRFPVPDFLVDSALGAHFLTWGALAIEVCIPLLVWSRRARPWVLGLGVALHLGIDYSLRAGLFSWVVLAGYVAFVPPETMTRALERLRRVSTALAPTRRGRVVPQLPITPTNGAPLQTGASAASLGASRPRRIPSPARRSHLLDD